MRQLLYRRLALVAILVGGLASDPGTATAATSSSMTCGFCVSGVTQCGEWSVYDQQCKNQCGLPYAGACVEETLPCNGSIYIVCYAES